MWEGGYNCGYAHRLRPLHGMKPKNPIRGRVARRNAQSGTMAGRPKDFRRMPMADAKMILITSYGYTQAELDAIGRA